MRLSASLPWPFLQNGSISVYQAEWLSMEVFLEFIFRSMNWPQNEQKHILHLKNMHIAHSYRTNFDYFLPKQAAKNMTTKSKHAL